uniref:J domain-containing protein n=1 Tax=Globisporangium ultimum (strain ATCC 200006 / CBS 805.95 / DAOM BR144) TaxID=431595 RepID=K3W5D3_GLOUD
SASQAPPAPSSSSSSSPPSSGSEIYQQLSFCCLVCGWETPCTSCPFDWYGFDPRKHRRRTHAHARHRSSTTELQEACATLGLDGANAKSLTPQEIKAAFRKKALEWHPDCSAHENAEATFKEIVLAYELLAATFPSS